MVADETYIIEQKVVANTKGYEEGMGKVREENENTGESVQKLSKIQNVLREGTNGVIKSLKSSITPTRLVGGAIGVVTTSVALAVKEFAQFEYQLSKMNTIAGLSRRELANLGSELTDMAISTGADIGETLDGAYQALSSGVGTDYLTEYMETANKLAIAGFTDVGTAVDATSTILNAYGLEAKEVTRISDMLIATQNNGKTTIGELGGVLANVIPVAAALGVEFDQVGAGIATLTAQGVSTGQATTQLRAMMSELAKEGTKASEVFKTLAGKSFQEFIENGGDLADVVTIMETAASELDISMMDLFSSVEASQAAMLLAGKGAESFKGNLDDLQESTGATDKAHAEMMNSIRGQWNEFTGHMKGSLIWLGSLFGNFVTETLRILNMLFSAIGKLRRALGKAIEEESEKIQKNSNFNVEGLEREKEAIEAVTDAVEEQAEVISRVSRPSVSGGQLETLRGILAGRSSGKKNEPEKDTRERDFFREQQNLRDQFYAEYLEKEEQFKMSKEELDRLEQEYRANQLQEEINFYENELGEYEKARQRRIELQELYNQMELAEEEKKNSAMKSVVKTSRGFLEGMEKTFKDGRVRSLKDIEKFSREELALQLAKSSGEHAVLGVSEGGKALVSLAARDMEGFRNHSIASAQNLAIAAAFGASAKAVAPGGSGSDNDRNNDRDYEDNISDEAREGSGQGQTIIVEGMPREFFDYFAREINDTVKDKYDQFLFKP